MKDTLVNPKLNGQMLDKYSFYMLLSDNSSNSYGVYIGKARSFSTRVLGHLREKPNWTIEAVGKEAGFGGRRTFQMEVKRRLGITPLQYRQGMGSGTNPETPQQASD